MKKERIAYLDFLKGIGIFLVVYEHVAMLPGKSVLGNILMCMSYGAVPCFMMVTGGLMHRKKGWDWQSYVLRLVRMYLILCFWKGMYLVFYKSLYSLSFSAKDIFSYLFLFGSLPDVNAGLLWYLEAYLAVMLLYPVTWFLFRQGNGGKLILMFWGSLVYLGTLGAMGGSRLAGASIQAVAPYMTYGNMFLYFIVGAFLLEEKEKINSLLTGRWWGKVFPFALIFAGTLGLMLLKFWKTGTFCWEGLHVSSSYYRISTILLSVGLYLAAMLTNPIQRKSGTFLKKLFERTTMGVYVLHGILVPCIQLCIFRYFPGHESLILHLLITCGTVVICAAATWLLQKIPVIRRLVL